MGQCDSCHICTPLAYRSFVPHLQGMIGHKIKSTFTLKCPRCHQGNLFLHSNAYDFGRMGDMPDSCPVCGENFRREPGFYYGAMYVSYALTIAQSVAVFVAMYTFGSPHWKWYLLVNALSIVAMFPLIFRWSRAIWINFFVHYDAGWAAKAGKETR